MGENRPVLARLTIERNERRAELSGLHLGGDPSGVIRGHDDPEAKPALGPPAMIGAVGQVLHNRLALGQERKKAQGRRDGDV
jgi:hypothetical protein